MAPDAVLGAAAPDVLAHNVLTPDVLAPDMLVLDVLAPDVLTHDVVAPDAILGGAAPDGGHHPQVESQVGGHQRLPDTP